MPAAHCESNDNTAVLDNMKSGVRVLWTPVASSTRVMVPAPSESDMAPCQCCTNASSLPEGPTQARTCVPCRREVFSPPAADTAAIRPFAVQMPPQNTMSDMSDTATALWTIPGEVPKPGFDSQICVRIVKEVYLIRTCSSQRGLAPGGRKICRRCFVDFRSSEICPVFQPLGAPFQPPRAAPAARHVLLPRGRRGRRG